jgi:hypothetical protein
MSYIHVIENVGKAVEAVGAGIMVLGGLELTASRVPPHCSGPIP